MIHSFISNIPNSFSSTVVAAAVASLLACFQTATVLGGETGTITGTIRYGNGDPIYSAVVIVMGQRLGANTDSTGAFTIQSVPAGTFTLKTMAIGANSSEHEKVQVTPGQVTTVDFTLQRSREPDESSPVYNGSFDPCDDLVDVERSVEPLVQIGVEFGKTAGVGEYRYNVKNRSAEALTEIRIGYDRVRGVCELELSNAVPDTAFGPPGWFCVPVQGEDSTTFALAWKVRGGEKGIAPRSSLSGFRVITRKRNSLYSDSHWYAGTAPQLWSFDRQLQSDIEALARYYGGELRSRQDVDAISMATGTIVGVVTDQGGKAVSGATVETWNTGLSVTSDSRGAYAIPGVPVGTHALVARGHGYQACGKRAVGVSSGDAARVDFHLSTGAIRIPCSLYTTDPKRLDSAFPRDAVNADGARFLDRGAAGSAVSRNHHPVLYSFTNRDIEIVYAGIGSDTAARAFVATVRREFRNPAEERLLRIAEETYPPAKAVASVADDRLDRKDLARQKRVWWYDDFDGVRLPYAVTGDAVRYYLELTQAFGKGDWSKTHIRMKRSDFSYSATISAGPTTYSKNGLDFTGVYIVELKLGWSNYCGTTCACFFDLDRTVVLRPDGSVVCVIGDRKPMVVVS
jgi:hypothetical protein